MKPYNINNDYSYLSRMIAARRREEEEYLQLKKESENAAFLAGIGLFDLMLAGVAFLIFV